MNTNLKKDSLNQNERLSSNILPELPVSKFDRSFTHKTTFDSGRLVPIMLDEILPGDSIELNINALIRSVVPVAPVMDNAKFTLHAFFVPNRLVWDKWKSFMGESNNAWLDAGVDTIPVLDFMNANTFAAADDVYRIFGRNSLFSYLGIPIISVSDTNNNNLPTKLNALPIRAYVKIWNDWYRDQNLQDALLLDTSSNNVIYNSDLQNQLISAGYNFWYDGSDNNLPFNEDVWHLGVPYGLNLATVSKFADYFTSALPSPQRGEDTYLIDSIRKFDFSVGYPEWKDTNENGATFNVTDADNSGSDILSVNELRYAISIQHFKELDARGGTRYIEIVKNHFGVESQDLRVQRAQFLGGVSQYIQIHQVNQTTPTASITSPNQGLGSAGAQSITYVETQNTIKSSFTEHGFLMVLCSVRPENSYAYGLERLWTKYTKFDYFWPTFDNIGEQPVYQYEIMLNRENMESNAIFGYMPAWSDYRYKLNKVSGYFSPKEYQSLVNWTYTTNYGRGDNLSQSPRQVVLNGNFIQQSSKNVAQTLTYQNMHQYLATFYFDYKHSRVMKVDSIPGIHRI